MTAALAAFGLASCVPAQSTPTAAQRTPVPSTRPAATAAPAASATGTPPGSHTPTPSPSVLAYPTPDLPDHALTVPVNFPGLKMTGRIRADLNVVASADTLLLTSNDEISLLEKDGTPLAKDELRTFFLPVMVDVGEDVVDPRAVFDPHSQRFYISAIAHSLPGRDCFPDCPTAILVAVSADASPASFDSDQWRFQRLDARTEFRPGGQVDVPSNTTPDFQSLGVTENFIVVSYQINRATDERNLYSVLRVAPKVDLVAGGETPTWRDLVFESVPYPLFQPAVGEETGDVIYLVDWHLGTCQLIIGRLDAANMELSVRRTPVPPCISPPSADQPAGPDLDYEGGTRERPTFRSGSLWITGTVGMTAPDGVMAGVRFLQLDVSSWPELSLAQDVTTWDADVHYFLPSIAANRQGDAAIVLSCSGPDQYLGICFTGRRGSDPASTLRPVSVLMLGEGPLDFDLPEGHNPFEDYAGAWLDPTGESAWLTAALPDHRPDPENDRWYSWVFEVSFEQSGSE